MSPSSSRFHLFGSSSSSSSSRRRRGRGRAAMGCAQGKPSNGSPARSDGRGIDHLMRNSGYVPAARRLTDPLPTGGGRGVAVGTEQTEKKKDSLQTETTTTDAVTAAAVATVSPSLPPNPPRREDEQLVDGWPTWLLENVPREALQGIVPRSADAYDKVEKVGQGTYSNVYKARERGTGRVVALKKVRFDTAEPESVRFMAREMRIIRRLDHPNVIRLDGIATSRMHRSIYLVFEFMYSDLSRLISRPPDQHRLTEPQIKRYMQQLLSGLQHCHERGVLHRDIKGSNLLIDRHGVLKIGDFGLANYYGPGRRRPLTSRVVTLWYRAPELLLGSTDYGEGIDLWSAGCLLAEMFLGRPLMPGRTEVEQLFKIFSLCGSPPDDYWRKMKLPASFRPPKTYKPTMMEKFADLPPSSLHLLATLLALDPATRGTAAQALQSNFFSAPPSPCDISDLPVVYKEEEEEALGASTTRDGRKPKQRQRSQKRRDSKEKAEEQQAYEPKLAAESPDRKEEKAMDDTAKSGQEPDDTVGGATAIASSSAQEPVNTIAKNASSSSTVSTRFSVSPVQALLPADHGSPANSQNHHHQQQEQQLVLLRRSDTHRSSSSSSDNHSNHKYNPVLPLDDREEQKSSGGGVGVVSHHSVAIRSVT